MDASVVAATAAVLIACSREGAAAACFGAGVRRRLGAAVDTAVQIEVAADRVSCPVVDVVRSAEVTRAAILVVVDSELTGIRRAGSRCTCVCDRHLAVVVGGAIGGCIAVAAPEPDLAGGTAACVCTRIDNDLLAGIVCQLHAGEVIVAWFENECLYSNRWVGPPPPTVGGVGSRANVGVREAVVVQLSSAAAGQRAAVARVDCRTISIVRVLIHTARVAAVRLAGRVGRRIRRSRRATEAASAAVGRLRIDDRWLAGIKRTARANVAGRELTAGVLRTVGVDALGCGNGAGTSLRNRSVNAGRAGDGNGRAGSNRNGRCRRRVAAGVDSVNVEQRCRRRGDLNLMPALVHVGRRCDVERRSYAVPSRRSGRIVTAVNIKVSLGETGYGALATQDRLGYSEEDRCEAANKIRRRRSGRYRCRACVQGDGLQFRIDAGVSQFQCGNRVGLVVAELGTG